jgi:hypothetical protein
MLYPCWSQYRLQLTLRHAPIPHGLADTDGASSCPRRASSCVRVRYSHSDCRSELPSHGAGHVQHHRSRCLPQCDRPCHPSLSYGDAAACPRFWYINANLTAIRLRVDSRHHPSSRRALHGRRLRPRHRCRQARPPPAPHHHPRIPHATPLS